MQPQHQHHQYTKHPRHPVPGTATAESRWIAPPLLVSLAPNIVMGITYPDNHTAVYKFWHQGKRIQNITPDDRHQLDLRTSLGLIITELCHQHDTADGHIIQTLIEIAPVPLNLIGTRLGGAA